jgi:hypothetical protein
MVRMSVFTWQIDDALRLKTVDALPPAAQPKRMREQALDTLMLRNADTICRALFGVSGAVLYYSTMCWGAFDVAYVLKDGRVACIENKGVRATAADFRKFVRDIKQVKADGPLYLASRWQHLKDYWDDYLIFSQRMMASFYLCTRCDTEPDSADLVEKACAMLGIPRSEFAARHDAAAQWLHRIRGRVTAKSRGHVGLYEYLKAERLQIRDGSIVPVVIAPGLCTAQVSNWTGGNDARAGVRAMLVDCSFYSEGRPYPSWFRLESRGTCRV